MFSKDALTCAANMLQQDVQTTDMQLQSTALSFYDGKQGVRTEIRNATGWWCRLAPSRTAQEENLVSVIGW